MQKFYWNIALRWIIKGHRPRVALVLNFKVDYTDSCIVTSEVRAEWPQFPDCLFCDLGFAMQKYTRTLLQVSKLFHIDISMFQIK